MQGEFPKKFTALVVARSSKVPLTEGKGPDSRDTVATKQRLLCSDYPCACSHKSQLVFITRSGKFTWSFVAVKYNLLWCNQNWMLCSAHFVHIPIDLGLFSYSLMLLNNIHTCLVKDCSVLLLALIIRSGFNLPRLRCGLLLLSRPPATSWKVVHTSFVSHVCKRKSAQI